LDSGLVRVQLADGTIGWGAAYAADLDALRSIVRNRVAPLAEGQDALDTTLVPSIERSLHLMGRSGPVIHALSGLDIALWDLRGKLERVPVYALLGGAWRIHIRAYASLLQYYGDTELVRRNVCRAVDAGYGQIKLHEKTPISVATARDAIGAHTPLMVDVNCAWSPEEAVKVVREIAPFNPLWIEEPIWPPENIAAMKALRQDTGVAVAAGENASSVQELSGLVSDAALDYVQPSAIKAGGITTIERISRESASTKVRFAPHCAFFGPGLLATLHVLAAHVHEVATEHIFCELAFVPYASTIPMRNGMFELTDQPGLGADPEGELLTSPFVN
jgi:L-alanine-DL-glutamate epimerase-like enolase superfamily enzyme